MPNLSNEGNEHGTLVGKLAGSGDVIRIEFASAIERVNGLEHTGPVAEYLAPGFVDLQVNGFAGVDYNDPAVEAEAVAGSIRRLFQTGVARFFPTVITGSPERMAGALRRLAEVKREFCRCGMPEGDAMAGFHVEGPHISPEEGPRGAHPLAQVRPPDVEEFQRCQDAAGGEIRLVTVSPEYAGAPHYIAALARAGVVVAIGHTRANSEQIRAAVDAGATMSTHLGNGAHTVLHKTSNYIWDQLAEDRLTASFIVDGIHIPSGFLTCAIRSKGADRSVLVTDAVMPAMCPPGPYKLGELPVELLPGNRVVLRGETRLAGSGLSMDRAVGNCVRWGGVSLDTALAMATVNPARAARIPGRQRGLTVGDVADLVRFGWDNPRARSPCSKPSWRAEPFTSGRLIDRRGRPGYLPSGPTQLLPDRPDTDRTDSDRKLSADPADLLRSPPVPWRIHQTLALLWEHGAFGGLAMTRRNLLFCYILVFAVIAASTVWAQTELGRTKPRSGVGSAATTTVESQSLPNSNQTITPTAPTGSQFEALNPGLPGFPNYTLG